VETERTENAIRGLRLNTVTGPTWYSVSLRTLSNLRSRCGRWSGLGPPGSSAIGWLQIFPGATSFARAPGTGSWT
jgi:hypothetical protein